MKQESKPKEKYVEWHNCPHCQESIAFTTPTPYEITVRCSCGKMFEYKYKNYKAVEHREKKVEEVTKEEIKIEEQQPQ